MACWPTAAYYWDTWEMVVDKTQDAGRMEQSLNRKFTIIMADVEGLTRPATWVFVPQLSKVVMQE